jgi:hypothetical protein
MIVAEEGVDDDDEDEPIREGEGADTVLIVL